jgi:alpha-D-xyloside xylohydrolase
LPNGATWIDAYTGTKYQGGQSIIADAPLNRIPVFVKEGTDFDFGVFKA